MVLVEVERGRSTGLDRAGGGDVVGGDRVPEAGEDPGVDDVLQGLGLARHLVEERGAAYVGGALVPGEGVAGGHLEAVPALVAVEDLAIALAEHV